MAGRKPKTREELAPEPVDEHVGARIRMRRKVLGTSQETLAGDLGITFQQVQQYEKGANRVSASRLYKVARCLQVPVSYFFEGLGDPVANDPPKLLDPAMHRFLATSEGFELANQLSRIKRRHVRWQVVRLIRTLAEDEREAD